MKEFQSVRWKAAVPDENTGLAPDSQPVVWKNKSLGIARFASLAWLSETWTAAGLLPRS